MPTPGLELASRSLLGAERGLEQGAGSPRSPVGVCRAAGLTPPDPLLSLRSLLEFWLCVSVVYELFLIFILFQVRGFLSCMNGGFRWV